MGVTELLEFKICVMGRSRVHSFSMDGQHERHDAVLYTAQTHKAVDAGSRR